MSSSVYTKVGCFFSWTQWSNWYNVIIRLFALGAYIFTIIYFKAALKPEPVGNVDVSLCNCAAFERVRNQNA